MPTDRAPRVRLEPMDATAFRASFREAIRRHASDSVRRGLWGRTGARAAAAKDFSVFLANGQRTPGHHFAHIVGPDGDRVGETWYTARDRGGKREFWVDWITIAPAHRRKGYGRAALQALEAEAIREGADRIGLYVWLDNPGALALYTQLGYAARSQQMAKRLEAPRLSPGGPRAVRPAGTSTSRARGRSS